MKSAERRGKIGPSAGFVILELTEPADLRAVVRPMLRVFEHTQPADFIIGRVSLARQNEAGGSWGQDIYVLHVNI